MYKWIQNDIKLATDCSLSLFLVLDHLRSNPIHIGDTLLSERLSSESIVTLFSLILNLAGKTLFFELFQAVLNDLSCTLSVVWPDSAVSLLATVVLA